MTKEEWVTKRDKLKRRMQEIARKHGMKSPLSKGMGELAWGRLHYGEEGPSENKDNVVLGYGYALGVRSALLEVSRLLGWEGERDLSQALDDQ